jgi:hypothetical protein
VDARKFDVKSIDTPEFQALAEAWRKEPYGTRRFEAAYEAMFQHVDEAMTDLAHSWQDSLAASPASTPEAAPEQQLAMQDDRNALAHAIYRAAVCRGIIAENSVVSGPQLVMLCNDLAEAVHALQPAAPSDEQITGIARKAFAAGEMSWAGFSQDDNGKYMIPVISPMEFSLCRAVVRALAATTAGAATTSEDARDAEMFRWLEQNRTWRPRYRIKGGNPIEWQMLDDGEPWGQWGDLRKVIESAMRATQQEGGNG